jgi:hypothetical protein
MCFLFWAAVDTELPNITSHSNTHKAQFAGFHQDERRAGSMNVLVGGVGKKKLQKVKKACLNTTPCNDVGGIKV